MIPLLLVAGLLQSTATTRHRDSRGEAGFGVAADHCGDAGLRSRPGLVWAFIGGIALDSFSGGPMGASSLALMAATLAAGLGHRTLSRYNLLVPLGAAAIGTAIYGLTYLAILFVLDVFNIVQHRVPLVEMVQYVLAPAIAYNTVLMLAAMPFLNRLPESQDI